ncbi:MAG: DUF6340 family protein [Prevotellaceae bacterium]|nr:DUF6340 family protein [Prevotellaceae bacterium]
MARTSKHIGRAGACCLAALLLLGSCGSVEQLSIDYMLPGDVTIPTAMKRVGVVNNVPDSVRMQPGSLSVVATEALAEALGAQNYFDEVVICDSALRADDSYLRAHTLTAHEVDNLVDGLDVDLIISLENLRIVPRRSITRIDAEVYAASLDVSVFTTTNVYVPDRNRPLAIVHAVDSIFWEEYAGEPNQAIQQLIGDEEMQQQAATFAGSVPMKHLLPYWKQGDRYFYAGGSVNMRDAAYHARRHEWDKAIALWLQEYEQNKLKRKMQAAYNLALGYEMQDSIATAEAWALKAQDAAYQLDKVEEKKGRGQIDPLEVPHFIEAARYAAELTERREGLPRLNAQMERFH